MWRICVNILTALLIVRNFSMSFAWLFCERQLQIAEDKSYPMLKSGRINKLQIKIKRRQVVCGFLLCTCDEQIQNLQMVRIRKRKQAN